MANIPGIPGYVQPNVFSRVRTVRRSVSIPGGLRILSILGLGEGEETIVLTADGQGADGVNPDFTGSDNPDGRHFQISKTNLIPQRTTILKNGIPLNGIEDTIDLDPFNSQYDYRLEPSTGRIELQRAHLVDQGGALVRPGSNNVGDGTLSIELIDANAPSETWTIRATSVIRDAYGDPVPGNTVFTAVGSESGQPIDAYGAPVVFISDGETRDNGIIRVTISEGSVPFERGDRFTSVVESGVLSEGDLLEAKYIATQDLEDPEFFTDAGALFVKHGFPSESNTLSLGASMAFENGAFGVLALQAKPPIPRRTSEVVLERDEPLTSGIEGFPPISSPVVASDTYAFKYTLEKRPDGDTAVNIFVIDEGTGTETQIFPSKVSFYDATITADPFNNFIDNPNYSFSYTVILEREIEDEGNDGQVTLGESTFTASSADFDASNLVSSEADTFKQIRIFNRDKFGNDTSDVAGLYEIASVGGANNDDTVVTLTNASDGGTLPFTRSFTDLVWQLVDPADKSARILLTKDLATGGTIGRGDGLRVSYIDIDDADFFDTNWAQALDVLESTTTQMVVPLPNCCFSAIQQATVQHCMLMSSTANQRERVALIGAPQGVSADAIIGRELAAAEDIGVIEGIQGDDPEEILNDNIEDLQNYSVSANYGTTFRAVYFYPDQIVRVIQGTRSFIHGFYMAAAAGGLLAANANAAIPLTRKVLTGFSILRNRTYKTRTQNEIGNAGATLVVPVTGGGRVLHGKTTVASGAPEEEEISVVFIRDRVAQTLREVLAGFIGKPEDPTITAAITTVVTKTLQALIGQGLITQYANLSVNRDEVDPRQWNVSLDIQPAFPVNWIFIDISVGVL